MSRYGFLAGCYDGFTQDVNYSLWADYVQAHLHVANRPMHTMLDLACGTGTLTWLLAARGYEMIGVDVSPEMLSQAVEKGSLNASGEGPIFLCQSMDELDLYGTVDACICMLDSVNHVTSPPQLLTAFTRVHLFLEPGGLFLFDVLTPVHFEGMDSGLFLDETEDAYCVWRTEYEAESRLCSYAMDLFLREGDCWRREQEEHEEYAYTADELEDYLRKAGFVNIQRHGALTMDPPQEGAGRIFFSAWKEG